MVRYAFGLVLLASLAVPVRLPDVTTARADQKKDKKDEKDKDKKKDKDDKVLGIIWEYKITNAKGEQLDDGQFRGHEKQIFKGGIQIGSYTQPADDHIEGKIFKGELTGKLDIRRTRKDVWAGTFTKTGDNKYKAGEYKIHIEFKKD